MISTKEILADLTLKVGPNRIAGKAKGKMHLFTGEVQVTHQYDAPLSFNPLFLSVAALTGTPEPEKRLDRAKNPFKDATSFEFDRRVRFSSGENLRVLGRYSRPNPQTLSGTLELEGDIPSTPIKNVLHTVESWTRSDKSRLLGAFEMAWTGEHEIILAHTQTEYTLHGVDLTSYPARQFRAISIQNASAGRQYHQDEQISMFCDVPGHSAELHFLEPLVR